MNNDMKMERDFKGVWIPKEIWCDNDLTIEEKGLLVELSRLCTENGCFATDEYLSSFLNFKKEDVTKYISSLQSKGYIDVVLEYKENTTQILKRVIYTHPYRLNPENSIGTNN